MVNTEAKTDGNFSVQIVMHPETLGQNSGRADVSAKQDHAKLVAVIMP